LFSGTSIGGDTSTPSPLNGAVAKAVPGWPTGERVSWISTPDAANSPGAAFFQTAHGDRYVWGANGSNMLGAGTSTLFAGSAAGPVAPDGLLWSGTGRVELGRDFALALDETSTLVAVGRNLEGQLGNGSTNASSTLVDVLTLTAVSSFSVGQTSAAAITNGQLWAWGWNGSAAVTTPTRVGSGTGFTMVSVGDIHSLAIGPGGEIYSWGDSSFGALGRSGAAGTPAVVMRP
jgi:alpha-tubulin suppressor-like RCC1 family protein